MHNIDVGMLCDGYESGSLGSYYASHLENSKSIYIIRAQLDEIQGFYFISLQLLVIIIIIIRHCCVYGGYILW